jgi:hypothetical protein
MVQQSTGSSTVTTETELMDTKIYKQANNQSQANNHLTTSSLIATRIASTSHSCFLEPLESRYITNTKDARPYPTIQPSRLVSTFPSRPCHHPHLLPISLLLLLLFAAFAFSSIRFETCEHQRVW